MTDQLTMTERFPVNNGGAVLETACGALATAVHTMATRRALAGMGTQGYLIFWQSSPGQCGYLAFTTEDHLPADAEYASPGNWINAGYNVRNAIRDQFIADSQQLPMLDPSE